MLLKGLLGDLDTAGAACAGRSLDTSHQPPRDAFFPIRGTAQITARDAKAICNGEDGEPVCPIRSECLEYALVLKEKYGIWGGKSERERARIAKQRRVDERKRELEKELARKRRSDAAKLAWENRRRRALEKEQQEAKKGRTRSKGTSKNGTSTTRRGRAA